MTGLAATDLQLQMQLTMIRNCVFWCHVCLYL